MAIDKVVDSAALDAGLTGIADAIREKGGTSAEMTFPDGFVDAVGAISAKTQEVPPEYEQLDYVYFTGVQWIDTGYTWNANSKFSVDHVRYGFGMQSFSEMIKGTNLYFQYGSAVGAYIKIGSMNEVNISKSSDQQNGLFGVSLKIVISTTKGELVSQYPGMNYTSSDYSTNIGTTSTVLLSNRERPWHGLIFCFEVLENDVPVARMLPAKRKQDGVIGMYDVVRDLFLTDASGDGLAGGNFE